MHTTGFWNNPVHRRSPPISTVPALWQLWQIFQSYSRHNKEPHRSSGETMGAVLTTAVRNSPLPAVPCPASITIFSSTFQEHPSITFTLSVPPETVLHCRSSPQGSSFIKALCHALSVPRALGIVTILRIIAHLRNALSVS